MNLIERMRLSDLVLIGARLFSPAGICCLVCSLGNAVYASDEQTDLARAVTPSKQIIVYTSDPQLPHVLGVFAEDVRHQWREQLDLDELWRDPIVIVVRPRKPREKDFSTPHQAVFVTDLHLKFQLTWLTPPQLNRSDILTALVDSLCRELANRSRRVVKGEPFAARAVPLWTVEGLAGCIRGPDTAMRHLARRSLQGGYPQMAQALVESTQVPGNPLEKRLFQANAWLFVESLLDLQQGRRRLQQFIRQCGQSQSGLEAFWEVYGEVFTDERSLEKWWSIQLVRRTSRLLAENQTVSQTLQEIDRFLPTHLRRDDANGGSPASKVIPLADLWRYHEASWLRDTIVAKQLRLDVLRQQATPIIRPVIEQYQEALHWLKTGRLNRFRRALHEAEKQQDRIDKRARALTVYLDQIELRHGNGLPSQTLTNFHDTLRELDQYERTRRNPVSDYLDQIESGWQDPAAVTPR